MRTLQEKYNGIQEGKFSKDQFIVEARMQHPNIITRFNGYADAVQILKNKGMIKEAEESFSDVWKHTLETDNLDKLKSFLKSKGKEGLSQVKSKLSSLHGQAREKVAKAAGIELDENLNEAALEVGDVFRNVNSEVMLKDDHNYEITSVGDYIIKFRDQENPEWTATVTLDKFKELVGKGDLIIFPKKDTSFSKELEEWSPHGSPAFSGEKEKEKETAPLSSLEVGDVVYVQGVSGDNIVVKDKREDGTVGVGHPHNDKVSYQDGNKEVQVVRRSNIKEAKLTKKSLTDYRYKPTNDMDKYPYEQILRGLRVELEVLGVNGTPTAEEYTKALTKVSKNLEKDSIFYTNQLAGVNTKVDLHDKMVDATAKNTVDTFNGMKKIKDLKEDHSKNPNDKYVVRPCKNKKEPWAVWEGETRVKGFATKEEAKEYADKQNEKQGLTESTLREGIKNLIKRALQEEEEVYEMQGPKSDGEYKSELEDYLQDNQIYGYTSRIHNIMTGPSEEEASTELAQFLDDNDIYGYNKGIEQIYTNYDYSQHWMNQEDEDALFESVSLKDLLD